MKVEPISISLLIQFGECQMRRDTEIGWYHKEYFIRDGSVGNSSIVHYTVIRVYIILWLTILKTQVLYVYFFHSLRKSPQ